MVMRDLYTKKRFIVFVQFNVLEWLINFIGNSSLSDSQIDKCHTKTDPQT